jgi:hypothetical protein
LCGRPGFYLWHQGNRIDAGFRPQSDIPLDLLVPRYAKPHSLANSSIPLTIDTTWEASIEKHGKEDRTPPQYFTLGVAGYFHDFNTLKVSEPEIPAWSLP